MDLALLLDMADDAFGDRSAVTGADGGSLSVSELRSLARRAGAWLSRRGASRAVLVDVNSPAVPVLLFGAAYAGIPYVPLNYRHDDQQLRAALERSAPASVVVAPGTAPRLGGVEGVDVVERDRFLAELDDVEPLDEAKGTGADIAVLLFTSGTTGEPKAAVLRHHHLASYVVGTVAFMGAGEDEAVLVSVPPYHVAGTAAVLSAVYAGRRLAYLESFDAEGWIELARREAVTHAMVVPTMLRRLLAPLAEPGVELPHLRHLAYGGGRMPVSVVERAIELLPHVGLVNAYGLTETSSTIAVLGPEDHRAAVASDDPAVRGRLGSVGRPLPGVEVEVRGDGRALGPGEVGEIWLRGEQVSGEYLGAEARLVDGWFPTRDQGWVDEGGYLYLGGRLDDVIVRGGENLSPGEIEDVLVDHPAVADACVVGVPDEEWGEQVAAAVVLHDGATVEASTLRDLVRSRLRSSKVPERVEVLDELPYNETGKLLRRVVRERLAGD